MDAKCPHCGVERPYRWIGGYHCRENGFSKYDFIYDHVYWYQPNMRGRWPSDWPGR